jgi:hypothetical protein
MALVKQDSIRDMLNAPSAGDETIQEVIGQSIAFSESASLLGLPVELQKTILEYVSLNLSPSQRSLY